MRYARIYASALTINISLRGGGATLFFSQTFIFTRKRIDWVYFY